MGDYDVMVAERLARTIDRRKFMRRAIGFTFATVGGVMAGGALADVARAHTANGQDYCANSSGVTACQFPGGFCDGCNGHDCPSGYWFDTGSYASACWCTQPAGGRYFICCDCTNGSTYCGCGECVGSSCFRKPGRSQA